MAVPTTLVIDATQQTLAITTSRDAVSIQGRSIETGVPTDGEVLTYSSSASEWVYLSVDENVDDRVAALIQDSAGGGLTWTYDDSAGTLTPAYVGDSTLVTSGALNSGSITSGFTSIDVGSGAITTTGTVSGGVLTGTLSTASQTNITGVGTIGTGVWNAGAVTSSGALNVAGAVNTFYRAVNSGNPEIHLGASTAEDMYIQTVYDSSAQTLNYVAFVSRAASGTADKGEFRFQPDESLVLTIDDGGLEVTGGVEVSTTLAVTGAISGSTSLALATGATVTGIDNGSLGTSATLLATAGAIRTYIDAQVTAQDLDLITDSGNIDIDLDSESLTLAGGTGLDSSASSTTVTFAIDSTVATLAGSQTLTNKTLTTPVISSISNTGTVTLPTSTDTLVGKATTDTLTNKSISGSTNTLSAIANGSLTNSTVAYGGVSLSLGGADTTPAFNLSDATAYPGDSSLVTCGTITSGTWQGTTVAVNQGGTGLSSYTAGDVIYASGTTTLAKLAKGSDTEVLTLASGVPTWAAPTVGDITGVTAGTGLSGGGTSGTVTLNVEAAQTQITSVGALAAGSIASGFTSISTSYTDAKVESVVAGNLIDVSGATGDVTVSADLSELSTSTSDGDGDYFAVVDAANAQKKLTKANIDISGFNDAVATSITGTGALNAGSITSGFGAIDVGSSSIDGGTITGTFAGNITGNVTGNCSGTAGSATGNAATATALQTARTIGGTSFDGTANIAVGLSATATALATARDINGTSFDGTAAITVTAAASTLTGTELKSTVVTSSLTSVGTISSLVATTADINAGTFDGIVGGTTPADGSFSTLSATGAVTADAGITMTGTTPTLTIGDAGTEDTKIVFDGNEQDYYIGLDDTDNAIKIGLGSAVGTTPAMMINSSSQFAFNNDNHTSDFSFQGSDDAITMNIGSPMAAVSDWSGLALGSITSPKGGVFYRRTAANYRGQVVICLNAEANTNKASLADDDDIVANFAYDKVTSLYGDCGIAGALSKGSGSFKIDHPLPDKKDTHHLVHSFIEGPRADLIYRGTADLSGGWVQVDLDEAAGMTEGTWELLCRDLQCWIQNDNGWSGVRGSVEGNTLTIECEDTSSSDSVSWMVVAERCDAHIIETGWTDDEGHPILEPLKPTDEG